MTDINDSAEKEAVPSESESLKQGASGDDVGEKKNVEKPIETEDYKSKFFYLAAEMENMRKRFERERENWVKFGNEKILSSLIEVVDNFDHSIAAIEKDNDDKVKNIRTGITMVRKMFLDVLGKNGLTPVESLGKAFDPNFHEALMEQEVEGKQDHEIINEFQRGYVLNGRLIRPAKVVVAKKK